MSGASAHNRRMKSGVTPTLLKSTFFLFYIQSYQFVKRDFEIKIVSRKLMRIQGCLSRKFASSGASASEGSECGGKSLHAIEFVLCK